MRRRLATAMIVVAVLAAACGDDDDNGGVIPSDTTTEKSSGPQTFPVRVDAKSEPNVSWISYFPTKLTARPGDSIEFTGEFTGAVHTVMGGTLVSEVAKAAEKAEKADPKQEGPPPPELDALFKKLPGTFNEESKGADDLFVQAGLQPCFSATEDPPTTEACSKEQQELPDTFTGKERFVNSGFLANEDTFKVKLADDLKPGTYVFACAVHGTEMSEEVTVVAKGADVPSADDVKAAGEKELGDLVAKAKPAADKVAIMTDPKKAEAGAFPEEEDQVPTEGINVFPAALTVKKGDSVTWTVNGFHTIAFNAPEDARPFILRADDGTISANVKSFAPANSPKIPDPPKAAEGEGEGHEGPPPQVKVDGGKYDGKGFMSSGLPLSEAQLVYTRTFTEAGTFKYICLIHPDMEGTVKVT
ncbi:MAG TPA: hypothetical protein VMZ51_03740 [Acidimicrobiales bacterium]|nr:hypothetical protein [Acidimicrobiales bacterium]